MVKDKNKPKADPGKRTIQINSRTIIAGLFLILFVLIILSLAGQYLRVYTPYEEAWGLIPLVYMARSQSISTILQVLLLFLAAVLLAAIAVIQKRNGDAFYKHWIVLAFAFIFLSLNEGSGIERLVTIPMRDLLRGLITGWRVYRWHITLFLSLAILLAFFRGFYKALPGRVGRLMLIALALYLVGFGLYRWVNDVFLDYYDAEIYLYAVLMTIAKSFEISGVIIFIQSLLIYLKIELPAVKVDVENNSSAK